MQFGYTIIYVPDVGASLAFFEKAFGLTRRFLHESGTYGELNTGETTLGFAAHALGAANMPEGYIAADTSSKPLGMEIGLVTSDVARARATPMHCRAAPKKSNRHKSNRGDKPFPRCAAPMARWWKSVPPSAAERDLP
jgi:lactoylglutathione lyase